MENTQTEDDEAGSLAQVVVSRENLLHNLHQYTADTDVAPVLKSNAYGHGLTAAADVITGKSDVPFVSLAAYRETKKLRAAGISIPALLIGYTPPETILANELGGVHFAISTLHQLKVLSEQLDHSEKFHLKIETGMHRYGIKPEKLEEAISLIKQNDHINCVGAFSHFSDAYTPESEHTHKQIRRWNDAVNTVSSEVSLRWKHTAATSGHFYQADIDANLQRIGIGFYGITGYAADMDLKPALSLQSFVAGIKTVAAGQPIGYNRSFHAPEDMEVAVIPIGYQEGVDRRLSNTGCIKVNDTVCPVVGKVSMNATMVDTTDAGNVHPRDPVEVYSAKASAPHSILNQADTADTIPYDILTGISPELERSVV